MRLAQTFSAWVLLATIDATVYSADVKVSPAPTNSQAAKIKPSEPAIGYSHLLPSNQDLGSESDKDKDIEKDKSKEESGTKEDKEAAVKDSRWIQPSPNPGMKAQDKNTDSKVKLTVSCTNSAGTTYKPDEEGYADCARQINATVKRPDGASTFGGRMESGGSKPTVGAGFNVPVGK